VTRIVHLGLGNFHRAHQVWWTGAVTDDWEICSYSHRRVELVQRLSAQGCRFTVVERSADGDRYQLVTALSEAVDGRDTDHLRRRLADPDTRMVTLTVTEGGYHLRRDGRVDLDSAAIRGDLAAIAAGGDVNSPAGRLLLGLIARRRADAGPLAVVPCDNIPANGRTLGAAMLTLAEATAEVGLADWIASHVSFVDTCVDRITPRVTEADLAGVQAATGWPDRAPVVTEPFRDWVLSGSFPGGRPAWELAGARFVDDIEPWERRKLYLLNGAHSLLAYLGLLRGHETVAGAIADPVCARAVERWWDEVGTLLTGPEAASAGTRASAGPEAASTGTRASAGPELDLPVYQNQLRDRFANPAIAHNLAQIAEDAVHKLRIRVAEPALRLRRRGATAGAAAATIAAWAAQTGRADARTSVAELSAELSADNDFVASVHSALKELA
jgi:fructuronate reductase